MYRPNANADSCRTAAVKPLTHAYEHHYIIKHAHKQMPTTGNKRPYTNNTHTHKRRTQLETKAHTFICLRSQMFVQSITTARLQASKPYYPPETAITTAAATALRTFTSQPGVSCVCCALLWRGTLKFTAWRPHEQTSNIRPIFIINV
ncbi:unnamed protein product [Ceratitis capitata]|uniref:(Mediterranean fruit fly) hypothetical protein n=1 Tax=Ceratitis capitata TaxID=7213 RepID=A0A811UNL0_CERCA|nr:unnamed protein product [Ceratitis capitata]